MGVERYRETMDGDVARSWARDADAEIISLRAQLEELTDAQEYALALLTEEFGESLQVIGKAGRFGVDTPGVKDALTGVVDMSVTPRTCLEKELGDVMAAIDYAIAAGLLDGDNIRTRRHRKLSKLLDPRSLDNLGRRLAPSVRREPAQTGEG